jgi:hypothetical protein
VLTKISEGVVNKFPKLYEGVYHSGTTSTVISEGLEKNSEFPRGSSGKPFLKGSKIIMYRSIRNFNIPPGHIPGI